MQNQIQNLLLNTISQLQQKNLLPQNLDLKFTVEPTKNSAHGDFASNIALTIAKNIGKNPLALAELIAAALPKTATIEQVVVAKPGFINFYLSEQASQQIIIDILEQKNKYAHLDHGKNKNVIIEFVSSNPTGPLHVGHGRGAAFGATVANLLETMGFIVHREYYVNDAGRQMDVLTTSIWLRYLFPC